MKKNIEIYLLLVNGFVIGSDVDYGLFCYHRKNLVHVLGESKCTVSSFIHEGDSLFSEIKYDI